LSAEDDIVETLNSVDWDFPGASTGVNSIHSLHWFPGNFIPQIPAFLIEILSRPRELVVDPFCGSGTTGIEALRLGRNAWLSDSNPACIQVALGKNSVLSAGPFVGELEQIALDIAWQLSVDTKTIETEGDGQREIWKWFHPTTLAELLGIWRRISRSSSALRPALEMLFTDVLYSCASAGDAKTKSGLQRRHHWGWIADNVRPKILVEHHALELYSERLGHLIRIVRREHEIGCQMTVATHDARSLPLLESTADLIVTSPPYVGMIDYTRANRLTYLWMNWPLAQHLESEIGARCYRYRKNVLVDYLKAMESVSMEMYRVLKGKHYCAMVVGSSRIFPAAVDALMETFSKRFRVVWGPKGRRLARRRISEQKGSEQDEFVVVFQK